MEETKEIQTEEIQTVKINDIMYRLDSVTEMGGNLINDIQKVEGEIGKLNLQISIAKLAKQKLIEELEKEIPNFVEIKVPEDSKEA